MEERIKMSKGLFAELTKDLKEVENPKIAQNVYEENNFFQLLLDIRAKKQKEVSTLGNIIDCFLQEDKSQIYKKIKSYLAMNEKNFLDAKPLCYYGRKVITQDTTSSESYFEIYGRSDYFPSKLEKLDHQHYCFTLPPMSSKYNSEKNAIDGKRMQYMLTYLMQEYEKENKIEMLHKPIAIFEHYVDTSAGVKWVPDADNLDTKVALDSVQGFIIADDSLLNIALLQLGHDAKKSYTKLHFMELDMLSSWLESIKKQCEKP